MNSANLSFWADLLLYTCNPPIHYKFLLVTPQYIISFCYTPFRRIPSLKKTVPQALSFLRCRNSKPCQLVAAASRNALKRLRGAVGAFFDLWGSPPFRSVMHTRAERWVLPDGQLARGAAARGTGQRSEKQNGTVIRGMICNRNYSIPKRCLQIRRRNI